MKGISDRPAQVSSSSGTPQAFVKFWGKGNSRESRSHLVFDEVERSGCHWACAYPSAKRPRKVKDGAVMFMGRLVNNPNDTIIFGRAIAIQHVPGRDDATTQEIKARSWKKDWPRYVRVHSGEFLAGTMQHGVSLAELMDKFGAASFTSTQWNSKWGGNTNPRLALRRQAQVELTPQAFAWLSERLEKAFHQYGTLGAAELERLDWPVINNNNV